MVVITLSSCPPALRGDLSAWLSEIDTGVYVGKVTARVREALWERVCQHIKHGRATLAYTARNEQGLEFRLHNTHWRTRDYEGLVLMMRPSAKQAQQQSHLQPGFSKAAKRQIAKAVAQKKAKAKPKEQLLVVDIETTGLMVVRDRILEIGALKVVDGRVVDRFQALVRQDKPLPAAITALTGITDQMLVEQGQELGQVMADFLKFAGSLPLVAHNAGFDYGFLRAACLHCGLPPLCNPVTDTYALARRLMDEVEDYQLSTLAAHLDIKIETKHRSLPDCQTTLALYHKLMEIQQGER